MKVDDPAVPPQIVFEKAEYTIPLGEKITLSPTIEHTDARSQYAWYIGESLVATTPTYTYYAIRPETIQVRLEVSSRFGKSSQTVSLKALSAEDSSAGIAISFPNSQITVAKGQTITISPTLTAPQEVSFEWYIDNVKDANQTGNTYQYQANKVGTYILKVIASKNKQKGTAYTLISVVEPDKNNRLPKKGHKATATKVFDFRPAPGQFINEGYSAKNQQEANDYALKRLNEKQYVSLGGFGGYIVVGFDHSIQNTGGYDFAIYGNSFKGSSEPGIVWVMQDENGNGLPDDTWYELRGSETGKPETIQDYEVTYYRPKKEIPSFDNPEDPNSHIHWTDNKGNKGTIDRNQYHVINSYYPAWIKEDQYTLRGTRLEPRTEDESGNGTYWVNKEFDWGYVDNFSPIDRLTTDINYNAAPNANHFKISDAMDKDLKPINLLYIDFIKVQTALNVKAGWLGENSTEVIGFTDINLPK